MRLTGHCHVWTTEELLPEFLWGEPREGEYLEDLGIDRRIISKWILRNWVEGNGLDLSEGIVTMIIALPVTKCRELLD
jgi:hypothetical protein